MMRGAIISPCGKFRYHLHREWGDGKTLLFVMLNPSTATGDVDDATIRRCIGFGKTLGFARIEVVNLFAYRATDPRNLRAAGYPVGPDNDDWTRAAAEEALETRGEVVCAWGANARGLARPSEVLKLLRDAGVAPKCLRITPTGHPQHPLMLPASCTLQPFAAL